MIDHYLRTALRNLKAAPFQTAVNIATLALGLVCFVTAFALVDYWQKSERQFAKADRTAVLELGLQFRDGTIRFSNLPFTGMHVGAYVKADVPELETVARANIARDTAIAAGDRSVRVNRIIADPEFLEVFDLPFVAGDPEGALRNPGSVVLTEETAKRLFGGEDPMGKPVILANQVDATVTGVVRAIREPSHLASSPAGPMRFDILTSWNVLEEIQRTRFPNAPWPRPENWLNACCVTYLVLPADGSLTVDGLNRRLEGFVERHIPPQQAAVADVHIKALPLSGLTVAATDSMLLQGATGPLSLTTLLLILGGLVLAVACINYANLASARAIGRAKEVGLRKVVGAARYQIAVQYLFEAGMQTAAAVAVAAAGIMLLLPLFRRVVGINLSTSLFVGLSFWVFLLLTIVAVTVVAGSYPALVLSRARPVEALRVGNVRGGSRLVTMLLVGAQFAAASFLLIALIVVYSQNSELRDTALGINSERLLMIDNPSRLSGVTADTLRAELLKLPQVTGVTATAIRPWSMGTPLNLVSRSADPNSPAHKAVQNWVADDYFSVLGIKRIAGRLFDRDHAGDVVSNDEKRTEPINIVVDRAFTEEMGFESPQDAIDKFVYNPEVLVKAYDNESSPPMRIVGVVESKPQQFMGRGAVSNMYMFGTDIENMIVRLAPNDVGGGVASIEDLWRRLSPHLPMGRYFLDDLFQESYEAFARANEVLVGLSVFAFFISSLGLFAMAIQVASRRKHEIGVRKTLGASARQIVVMLLRDFGKPVLIANVLAWPLAYLLSKRYLALFIHRIPLTPLPFVLSLALTIGIAWIAVGGQAYRAATVKPARVLRTE